MLSFFLSSRLAPGTWQLLMTARSAEAMKAVAESLPHWLTQCPFSEAFSFSSHLRSATVLEEYNIVIRDGEDDLVSSALHSKE